MRDSLGGIPVLVIIVVFIVVASGYLAFNVNYTKAFRMKDKVIATYDKYNGNCDDDCESEIENYAHEIGYDSVFVKDDVCDKMISGMEGSASAFGYYCLYKFESQTSSDVDSDISPTVYYKVATKVNVDIPIIRNIFNFRIFVITGDTKSYSVSSNSNTTSSS